ncbi:hypothetical protein [Tenacibaculum halocynthiae]|uniref:hypothetical protein n=1 Tax=Tenacibaculum halocynthiae TaxID=1254437 RepID=UPI003892FB58
MKKISITMLFLLLGFVVKAQDDITLYRFMNKQLTAGGLMALQHNTVTNKATLIQPHGVKFDLNTGYLQALIIQQVKNKDGVVFISSLKNKGFFLKYNEPGNFSFAKMDKTKQANFMWEVNYAGPRKDGILNEDLVYLSPINEPSLSIVNENGELKLTSIFDGNGAVVDNKKSKLADKFIFYLQKMNNAF